MDAFISYSRKDKPFVQKLYGALTHNEKQTWVDWEDIPLTADWWAEIEAGVEAANVFIFVISPDSINSKVCNQEIEHAVKHNKRLIPIVYRDASGVPEVLSYLNWLFFRETDNFDEAFKNLLEVMETDFEWVKRHTRLTERAVEWDNKERNASYLLRGDDLAEAEQHLYQPKREPVLTELQQEYIVTSQQNQAADLLQELEQTKTLAETEKQRLEAQTQYSDLLRRRTKSIIGAVILLALISGFAIFSANRNGKLAHSTQSVIDTVVEFGSAEVNADVCRAGALNGVSDLVIEACNRAINLEPKISSYYENRSIAHILMDNHAAASTDITTAIELARELEGAEDQIQVWEMWLLDLQADRNPFREDYLEQMRRDWTTEHQDHHIINDESSAAEE